MLDYKSCQDNRISYDLTPSSGNLATVENLREDFGNFDDIILSRVRRMKYMGIIAIKRIPDVWVARLEDNNKSATESQA